MHPGAFMDRLMKERTFHHGALLIPTWWNWQDGWTALRQGPCSSREGKHQPGFLLRHVCLTLFSQWRQWFNSLERQREWVCVSERSVCPQKHACFHLQVNINNPFCHQGMFVMAKRWKEFSTAAAALLGEAAGQHFTTCHHSLPKRHLATNLQSCCCPFF